MLLSLVNCAIVRTAQLTSESNILFISSCSAELKEIVTPVGSFQFVRRRSLLHSQQLVQTLSCCWHFPLWSVWILHVSGCVFCDIKNVNNSTLFWQAQCRQIRKVTSRAQKFSWNKEVWGEKKKHIWKFWWTARSPRTSFSISLICIVPVQVNAAAHYSDTVRCSNSCLLMWLKKYFLSQKVGALLAHICTITLI